MASSSFNQVYRRNELRYSTVRLEAIRPGGSSVGTACVFLLGGPVAQHWAPFLATNYHVIENCDQFKFLLHTGDPSTPLVSPDPRVISPFSASPIPGRPLELDASGIGRFWHRHPDPAVDVAVLPLMAILAAIQGQGKSVYVEPIADVHIPDFNDPSFEAIEEIFFVGYPDGIYDAMNLTPIARRGITATPMSLDYRGEPKFLVDASVYQGSSGSPVFISDSRLVTGDPTFGRVNRHFFLGLISDTFLMQQAGSVVTVPAPTGPATTVLFEQIINLGIVIKSTCVKDAVIDAIRVNT